MWHFARRCSASAAASARGRHGAPPRPSWLVIQLGRPINSAGPPGLQRAAGRGPCRPGRRTLAGWRACCLFATTAYPPRAPNNSGLCAVRYVASRRGSGLYCSETPAYRGGAQGGVGVASCAARGAGPASPARIFHLSFTASRRPCNKGLFTSGAARETYLQRLVSCDCRRVVSLATQTLDTPLWRREAEAFAS